MHTAIMIAAGLALLGVFKGGARIMGRSFAPVLSVYLGVWAAIAVLNGGIGVVGAGYSIVTEALVFLPVFGIPALVAVLLARRG